MSVPALQKGGERKPKGERWAELLQAATEVFAEKGYDAASLQDIAERIGILKGSLYHYITSKGDLLVHLLKDTHFNGVQSMLQIANTNEDPLTRLFKMILEHISYVCRNPAKASVYLQEVRRLSAAQRAEVLGDEHGFRNVLDRVIQEGRELGLVRSQVNPKLAATFMLSSLNSITTWYRRGGEFTPQEIAQQFSASILMGLSTPKGVRILAHLPAAIDAHAWPITEGRPALRTGTDDGG